MKNGLARTRAAEQVWALEVDAKLSGDRPTLLTEEALEPMVELMLRTRGVRSAAVTVRERSTAVAVWVSLAAGAAADALRQATALVGACARYAGLTGLTVRGGRVAEGPAAH